MLTYQGQAFPCCQRWFRFKSVEIPQFTRRSWKEEVELTKRKRLTWWRKFKRMCSHLIWLSCCHKEQPHL